MSFQGKTLIFMLGFWIGSICILISINILFTEFNPLLPNVSSIQCLKLIDDSCAYPLHFLFIFDPLSHFSIWRSYILHSISIHTRTNTHETVAPDSNLSLPNRKPYTTKSTFLHFLKRENHSINFYPAEDNGQSITGTNRRDCDSVHQHFCPPSSPLRFFFHFWPTR